jgi:Ca2+-binding RTX toxin-like protein
LSNIDRAPVVRDDLVITSRGADAVPIPLSALLFNDADPDGQEIAVSNVMNATSGSVVLNTDNITFTEVGGILNGGTFTYAGTAGGLSDTGLVTINRSQIDAATLEGTGLGEILIGRNGADDTISGLEGNDVLIGGGGNDELDGGDGIDLFFFQAGSGQDVIDNFQAHDQIELAGIPGITNFNDLEIVPVNGDSLIHLENGNSILVANFTNLQATNFLIHA